MHSKTREPAPELFVEKAALGEATAAEQQRLGESGPARLAALRESNAEILARYPAGPASSEIQRRAAMARAEQPRQRPAVMWISATALLACCALIGLFVAQPGQERGTERAAGSNTDEVRLKGLRPHLAVFRQEGSKTAELTDGAKAKPGDVVQLGYAAAGQRQGVLLSIDGRGGVTLHFPAASGAAAELTRGGLTLLGSSFTLDDAPGFERFFFVTSAEQPLSVADVLERARRLASDPAKAARAPLELPPGLTQTSLILRKPE
jgi:hypothetical protein